MDDCAQDNIPPCMQVACLNGSCELVAGTTGLPCDDGDVCTEGTLCNPAAGGCSGGTQLNCNDDNPCTNDTCDSDLGCQHEPFEGPCDDGNVCTDEDTCSGGTCAGIETAVCDDGNPCTADTCDPSLGCLYPATPDGEVACDDGEPCTVGDSCIAGTCTPGELECEPCDAEGSCPAQDDLCAGELYCSDSGYCAVVEGSEVDCDDGNSCTEDTCAPRRESAPTRVLADGEACDDGNDCTLGDACEAGACTPAQNAAGGSICEDGDPCAINDTCDLGVCYAGDKDASCIPGCIPAPLLAGCNGCPYESCVCETNPECCETSWDATCSQLCDECGGCEELPGEVEKRAVEPAEVSAVENAPGAVEVNRQSAIAGAMMDARNSGIAARVSVMTVQPSPNVRGVEEISATRSARS